MNNAQKILIVDDSITGTDSSFVGDKEHLEVIPSLVPGYTTSPTSATTTSTNEMFCQVQGCKNKAIKGTLDFHLCEDHLHLMYKPRTYSRPIPKIGRNKPCICGSGKKFKKCCGK